MDNLITIKTFLYAHEANVVRNVLESEGIFCFLKDELTIQANPLFSNALGGVKLQVRESDVITGRELLVKYGYTDEQQALHNQTIVVTNSTGTIATCPNCQSEEITLIQKPSGFFFGISVFLLGFPLPFFSKIYHCYNCAMNIKVKAKR